MGRIEREGMEPVAKHFYMQFDVGDWMKDAAVGRCAPATRGIWVDLLCAMHESGRTGELSGTHDQIARLGRCSAAELTHALTDLQVTRAADVTTRNGVVTITNRRMRREHEIRQKAAERQQRHRGKPPPRDDCNADVTPHNQSQSQSPEPKPDLNSQSPESNPSGKRSGCSGRLEKASKEGDLSQAVLRDEAAFRRWVDRERKLPHGLIRSDDLEKLAWAAREKALTDRSLTRPVGWIKDTLRRGAWDRVRQSHEEAGREAGREAGGSAAAAVGVVEVLKALPQDPSLAERRAELARQAEELRKKSKGITK
jgi:hypothetical protein